MFGFVLGFCAAAEADAQSLTARAGMQAYNRGDIAAAARLLREAANAGDAEAEVNLGYLYARGQGVAADQKEALRLYRASADQGNGEGMNALGFKYLWGTGVAVDPERAVYWFCLGVGNGNPRAMNNLALMLDGGKYVKRDVGDARSLWEQAAALGQANAMMNLATSYFGSGGADAAKGQDWLMRAARAGHPEAQNFIRAGGYSGPLPPPIYEAAAMIPEPRRKGGHAKICGANIS